MEREEKKKMTKEEKKKLEKEQKELATLEKKESEKLNFNKMDKKSLFKEFDDDQSQSLSTFGFSFDKLAKISKKEESNSNTILNAGPSNKTKNKYLTDAEKKAIKAKLKDEEKKRAEKEKELHKNFDALFLDE